MHGATRAAARAKLPLMARIVGSQRLSAADHLVLTDCRK
jgi:hypothetical protein